MLLAEMTGREDSSRKVEMPTCQVQLQPYAHQVGGHSCLMLFNNETICKPLKQKEFEFYLRMPDELRPFTPEFKGVTEVFIERDSSGYLTFYAFPDRCFSTKEALQCKKDKLDTHQHDKVYHLKDSLYNGSRSAELSKNLIQSHKCEACSHVRLPSNLSNPWTREVLERLSRKVPCQRRVVETFMLLENVAKEYKRPCVLDLKMGVRQYSEDSSQEKKERRIRRVEISTSGKLGTRLCGMQVYNPEEKSYMFIDKYKGRVMDCKELMNSLRQFFNKNTLLRVKRLQNCVTKLRSLLASLKSLLQYRFYSSSLLLMYDAYADEPFVDVRVIDFANTSIIDPSLSNEDCDEGFAFGLQNLINLLEDLMVEFREETE